MGGLLTLPIAVVSVIVSFSKKGIAYSLYFLISYAYFVLQRIRQRKRFDLYDFKAVGRPEKNGFFVPEDEWKLDPPLKILPRGENDDTAFIYGTNSKSESLAIQVVKRTDGNVTCSLFLKLSNGTIYSLPDENILQRETSEENTFGSARLKLQCLIPLRKWRIFFNGILKKHQFHKENCNANKHVKFTFIWTASSDVFDFSSDVSKSVLSNAVASSTVWRGFDNLKKLENFLDCYEQPGMIHGTISIENNENEIYLWGVRRRSFGISPGFKCGYDGDIYGHFENGLQIHLGMINVSGMKSSFCYGYIMKPTGYIFPIDEFEENVNWARNWEMPLKCLADGRWYTFRIKGSGSPSVNFPKEFDCLTSVKAVDMVLNDSEGKGLVFQKLETEVVELEHKMQMKNKSILKTPYSSKERNHVLSISFKEKLCLDPELCGGKGSSLANLFYLCHRKTSRNSKSKFHIPKGIVVTTNAYKEFISGELESELQKFEKDVWSKPADKIPSLCQNMVEVVCSTKIPKNVCQFITENLKEEFGDSFTDHRFAVRSSAIGEDTEQMSAAGQMETFLGVRGTREIIDSVAKCWASQFAFPAVEYKRAYGQPLNTPMAVVIQEMVNCDVAGVMFTCDPLSGNPLFISVTANWGLGESVVSASSDPDTFTLERDIDNKLKIHSKKLGDKKTKIVMHGTSGIEEVENGGNSSSITCIDENQVKTLGEIAIEVENHYGSPRDIEWGIASENFYLFQSRPVTSLDIESDFEIKHFFDTFHRNENGFVTKANVGEVMPGATSPLGIDLLAKLFDTLNHRRIIRQEQDDFPPKPYYQKIIVTAFNHTFLNMLGGYLRYRKNNEEEIKSILIAWFGRLIDDKEIRAEAEKRDVPDLKASEIIIRTIYLTLASYFAGLIARKKYVSIKRRKVQVENVMNSSELLQSIGRHFDITVEAMDIHIDCSLSSSIWNMQMLALLSKAKGEWDTAVFSDFAYLLSACNNLESADVPSAIQSLGITIAKEIEPEVFRKMSTEDALNWLRTNTSEAGNKFKQFIKRHGHRCLKEFDIYTNTWKSDPLSLIKTLQNFVSVSAEGSTKKEVPSFSSVLSKLQVKLSLKDKMNLFWILPNARRGVGEREYSKSLCIRTMDKIRKLSRRLADKMLTEGRLPRPELLYFLCIEEIDQLIKTRSPRLVAKAYRRWKAHEVLDSLMFPEICRGIPKPINNNEKIQIPEKGFKMSGVPVSQGVIKAPARVVMNLKEASSIQVGDILITYSTDIGWSPYFPLLSGVVTELGGLISHGAVVAREYGLPCVVGLAGATRAFQSGDIVILNGNDGTLQKVDDE